MQETLFNYQFPAFERSKVEEYIEEHQFLTNWKEIEHDGWRLPATDEPHYWCGVWKTVGCLNTEKHQQSGFGKTVFVKQFQRSCYRGRCKTCYRKWISRESNKATSRIAAYANKTGQNPFHVLLSVPPNQHDLPIKLLRKRMSGIIKSMELKATLVIFHPFRFHEKSRRFYYSPHFHLIGFGDQKKIANAFGKHGWFIKYLGVRYSVFQTVSYLMSHCGIRKGSHTVTWLGGLSYSKLKVEKEPLVTKCPCCKEEFVEIYCYESKHDVPPDRPFEGFVEWGSWNEVCGGN